MTIEWKNPPDKAVVARRTSTMAALEELEANPNQWGIVKEYKDQDAARTAASATWRRKAKNLGKSFEFVAAEGKVYGRYVTLDGNGDALA